MPKTNEQDSLFDIEPLQKESKETITGNRLSPSKLEKLSLIHEMYEESDDELSFLSEIIKPEKQPSKEEILKNAKWSIYGTQVHNLMYFAQIFERAKVLDRKPKEEDIRNTFVYRDRQFYRTMRELLLLTDYDSSNPSQSFWNEWRMKGQDFNPEDNSTYIIKPDEVQKIWEDSPVPLEDIHQLYESMKKEDERKFNPHETLLINEVTTITNIYFSDSNLQVPSVIDEIVIPKNFPKEPIHIVDYKTGKQFKEPGVVEKKQAFLMITAVYANILSKAGSAKFGPSDWEVGHNIYEFPAFKKRSLRVLPVGSIYAEDLIKDIETINNCITFSYVDPLTQRHIDFTTKESGTETQEEMAETLYYLNSLNNFYSKYKEVLGARLKSNDSLYHLPTLSKDLIWHSPSTYQPYLI